MLRYEILIDVLIFCKVYLDKYLRSKFYKVYLKRNCLFKFDIFIVFMLIMLMFLNL